ncbi:uncharacterized protein LOC124153924 [Ischnura elegans]|uniref:uncharacterized protein LOC124153924 n=1 Tax=Ischnura elegans TaxID=197161 RepID=UPI001ED8AB6F|nr:uncharacterized protein LOC124153924 [Ischnura elegans]XP_046383289.1 uncharacterized protein LOC124153924 [Ischnura elegans]
MASNPGDQPPSYEEAIGTSLQDSSTPGAPEQPGSSEPAPAPAENAQSQDDAEERKRKKAEEAGWRSDLLQPNNGPQGGGMPMPTPGTSREGEGLDTACGGAPAPASLSLEERNRLKAQEAGWKDNVVLPSGGSPTDPGLLSTPPMVLPPGLQPLIILDTLFLRGNYERGKGRRYKVMNKNGGAVLYARTVRRGHHHLKDFQLYDATRTAVVGQLAFTQAADNSLYASLECPAKVPLATIKAEDYMEQPQTTDPSQPAQSNVGVKYTICNALGQPVFVIPAPPVSNSLPVQIKVYSAVSPGTSVADIFWDIDEEAGGLDETQSTFGAKEDSTDERRVKITFPSDLEVKMKAAVVAMCLLKDKIDHRMTKGTNVLDAYRGPINDALGIAFGHRGKRRHHRF